MTVDKTQCRPITISLLPTLDLVSLRGSCISATASSSTTVSHIVIMYGPCVPLIVSRVFSMPRVYFNFSWKSVLSCVGILKIPNCGLSL